MRHGERQWYKNRHGVRITVTRTRDGRELVRAHSVTTLNFTLSVGSWDELFLIGRVSGREYGTHAAWASAVLDRAHRITPTHVY
jgi:hypothetical protein